MAKRADLLKVHEKEYVDRVFLLAEHDEPYDIDTPVSKSILDALMFIIGGVIKSGSAIFQREADRAVALGGGFHHAGGTYGGGFCLFNDIAILVEHLRERHHLKRILILDYDLHFLRR